MTWNVYWSCASVCLSLATFPHYCMDPDVTWGNSRVPWDYALFGRFAISARVSLLWQHSVECEMSASALYSLCAWLNVIGCFPVGACLTWTNYSTISFVIMNGDAYKNCHCHVCLGIAVDFGNTFIICSCLYWSTLCQISVLLLARRFLMVEIVCHVWFVNASIELVLVAELTIHVTMWPSTSVSYRKQAAVLGWWIQVKVSSPLTCVVHCQVRAVLGQWEHA